MFNLISFKLISTDQWNNYELRKAHQVALDGSDKTLQII